MFPRLWATLVAVACLLTALPAGAQTFPPGTFQTQVVTLQIGGPISRTWIRYLLITPTGQTPTQAVMLFAGGDGYLNIGYDGSIGTFLAGNFLVRSRELFASKGLAVAVMDAPNGQPLDGNIRLSANYAATISTAIADVRSKTSARRVWLIGTSAGSLSAAGVAARLPQTHLPFPTNSGNPSRPDGIVLPSTQSLRVPNVCGKIVQDATLSAINVPAYLVAHRDDDCLCSPASGAAVVLAALTGSPLKAKVEFTGGLQPQTAECDALSPHGFYGIEDQVVTNIATWVKKAK
jgi:hypothetical protein